MASPRLFTPLQFDDSKLNRTLRDLASLLNPLLASPAAAYAISGGQILPGVRVLVYVGDGGERLLLPSATAFAVLAGLLTITNLGGGAIQVAASGTDTTYDGHEYTVTPGRTAQFVSDGRQTWTIVGDEIWSATSPDHWYEHECDYSVSPRIESGFASPVLYDKQMNMEWITSGFAWTQIDEGPKYPGVVEGTLGLSATAALRLATELNAIYLFGRARYVCWVKIPVLSTPGERFIFRTGLADQYGATLTDTIGFRYSDNIQSGRWECLTYDAGAGTTIDSGVTVAADTWYRLEFDVWVPSGIAQWHIAVEQPNGRMDEPVRVATYNNAGAAKNLPGGVMGVVPFDLTKTVGTTARSVKIHKHRFVTNLGGPALPSGD